MKRFINEDIRSFKDFVDLYELTVDGEEFLINNQNLQLLCELLNNYSCTPVAERQTGATTSIIFVMLYNAIVNNKNCQTFLCFEDLHIERLLEENISISKIDNLVDIKFVNIDGGYIIIKPKHTDNEKDIDIVYVDGYNYLGEFKNDYILAIEELKPEVIKEVISYECWENYYEELELI